MNHILSITGRELRGFFHSAVAVIFLATFLAVVMFTFFWAGKFFARGIADIRPLFDWLPILLIFLVAALSMRFWSEEHRSGTVEILLTMPVPIHRLVLGKFLAGMILVALALVLTLGLPISVSIMGDLDWGPVIGGYLAALLLAGAYLSIGMCVSSSTDNQIVALIGTVLLCGIIYIPGTEIVAGLFGMEGAEVLRRIGSGSRFESIARGVLDLRDLAYYAGLMAIFLTLNALILQARRWGKADGTRIKRFNTGLAAILVGVNVIIFNLWMNPIGSARADLTSDRTYSLSPATRDILRSLDEPLIIRGYFSTRTHPLLAPLIPQIRDILAEYKVAGGADVQTAFLDPSTDEEIEKEAFEQYGIRSVPLQFADRRETSVVNTYFHILVAYGDQHEVLGVDDLIAVEVLDVNQVRVKLRNLEYDVTRAIRRVVHGFQSLDMLFATLPDQIELTAYITPDTLPPNLSEAPLFISGAAMELGEQSGGKLRYMEIQPETDAEKKEIYERFGIQPYAVSIFSGDHFYLHLLLSVGDRRVRVPLPEALTESGVREAITAALRRAAPGFTKVVGIIRPPQQPPVQIMPNMPPQQPPSLSFNSLYETLEGSYEIRDLNLYNDDDNELDPHREPRLTRIPDDIDVLLLIGPENLDNDARVAIDQYLMRGGAIILLAGNYQLDLMSRELSLRPVISGMEPLLEHWGIEKGKNIVADSVNDAFPMPAVRNVGGLQVREIRRLPYPYFPRLGTEELREGGVITSGISALIAHWFSPVFYNPPNAEDPERASADATVIMRSSPTAWLHHGTGINPDFERHGEDGFSYPDNIPEDEKGPHILGIALTGAFDSAFADSKADEEAGEPQTRRLMKRSPDDARLVVIGSSGFISDQILGVSERAGTRDVAGNMSLIANLVDWAVEDTALLEIRSRGAPRTIRLEADAQSRWEWFNYGAALIGLIGVVLIGRIRRRDDFSSAITEEKKPEISDSSAEGRDKE